MKRRLSEREVAEFVPPGREVGVVAGATGVPPMFSTVQSPSALVATFDKKKKVLMAVVAITDRLSSHFRDGVSPSQLEFYNLCYGLARVIDYAITFNLVPSNLVELAALVKQVYKLRDEDLLRSAVMVLMFSVKNACKNSWFQAADSNELLLMANEVCSKFSMDDRVNIDITNAIKFISMVILRFYPKMDLNRLICASVAKSGYRILVNDVNIPRDIAIGERIRLFVAQIDNCETSSCIITPPDVSFIVNGTSVEKRTNVSMDKGPQFPTDITKMLHYGMNLLQAIGSFNGNYLIAIATMKTISSPNACNLQSYSQPVATETEKYRHSGRLGTETTTRNIVTWYATCSKTTVKQDDPQLKQDVGNQKLTSQFEKQTNDSEVTISQAKISLNCPISQMRIKTPVKGYRCQHHSCFDFNNFMEMNSIKPSWHCPCCDQPLSYVDLRIDQNMVKILAEVGESVSDLFIFADGSWEISVKIHDRATQQETRTLPTESKMVDLTTEEDCEIISPSRDFADQETVLSLQFEDTKPFQKDKFGSSACESHATCATMDASRINENDSIFFASSDSSHNLSQNSIRNTQILGDLEPSVVVSAANYVDGILPAVYRDRSLVSRLQANYTLENAQMALEDDMSVQQPSSRNLIVGSESGRHAIPRHLSGIDVGVPVSTVPELGSYYPTIQASGNIPMDDIQRQFTTASQPNQVELRMQNQASQQIIDRLLQNVVSSQANSDGQARMAAGCRSALQPHLNMQNSQFYDQNQLVNNLLEPTTCMPSADFRSVSQTSVRVSHITANRLNSLPNMIAMSQHSLLPTPGYVAGVSSFLENTPTPIFPRQLPSMRPGRHPSSTLLGPSGSQLRQYSQGSAQSIDNQIIMDYVGATGSRTVQNTQSQFSMPPTIAGQASYVPGTFTPYNFNVQPFHSSQQVNFVNGNYGNLF